MSSKKKVAKKDAKKPSVKRSKKVDVNREVLWGNMINLAGLYCQVPREMRWDDYLQRFLDDCEGIDAEGPELVVESGFIQFVSKDKNEVEKWTEGVVAAMTILNEWCINSDSDEDDDDDDDLDGN